ncbi:MAG: flagellar biosynthetic protein FliO [Nitrosomonas sp.]|jgi:flagellar protein FliO/FliZ|nr:flagellar biosynthetic protein FliO [Nitrosomonas sp.]
MFYIRLLPMVIVLFSPLSRAESSPAQGFTPPPPVISTESMLQLFMGLLIVLALIGLLAWLFKKFGVYSTNQSGLIKIIASANVGQKERIVLTEINDTWLILGVAPGQVNLLHCINKSEIITPPSLDDETKESFPEKLRANLRQQHAQ